MRRVSRHRCGKGALLYLCRKTRYCHGADIPDRYARIEGARHTRNLASLRPADHFASRCASRRSAFNGPFQCSDLCRFKTFQNNVKVCTLPLSELDPARTPSRSVQRSFFTRDSCTGSVVRPLKVVGFGSHRKGIWDFSTVKIS